MASKDRTEQGPAALEEHDAFVRGVFSGASLEDLAMFGDWVTFRDRFVCCAPNPNAPARLAWERVANTRARFERMRVDGHTTFHSVPVYAITQYVPEDTGLEHGPMTLEDAWRADPSGFC